MNNKNMTVNVMMLSALDRDGEAQSERGGESVRGANNESTFLMKLSFS